MRRINVVGTSCSGKTTLARAIATRLEIEHVELDALFWGSDWTPVSESVFRARVEAALSAEAWTADGGYQVARNIIWGRADTVVWLDYAMPVVLGRWASRTVARIRSREEIWPGTGNRDSMRKAVGRDSLLWWILRTHRSKRRRMETRFAWRPDLEVVRLHTPGETDRWLRTIKPPG